MAQYITLLEIKSSEDFITPGVSLDLIAIKESIYHRKEVITTVEWSFSPKHSGISLNYNRLLVNNNVQNLEQITIYCTETDNGLCTKRVFNVIQRVRDGKLIHFIKNDLDYFGHDFIWDLWTYEQNKAGIAVDFSGKSDFGVTAQVLNSHVIARKKNWGDHWYNEWSEQTHCFELDMQEDNYYIIYGDNNIYTSLSDVVNRSNPRIEYAILDKKHKICASLSHDPLPDTHFALYINSQLQENITINHAGRNITMTDLPDFIRPDDLIIIKANKTFSPCKVTLRKYLDFFYYPDHDMGVIFKDANIYLRIWAPTATYVELLIYNNWDSKIEQPDYTLKLEKDSDNKTHSIQISQVQFEDKFYLYRLHFNDLDKNDRPTVTTTYAVDPYANGLGINGNLGCLIDINAAKSKPEGWDEDKKPPLQQKEDSVIYELHIRDFTVLATSGVSLKHQGKFL
ncbi:MAG: type I pullulanase, partial [Gammaproteobacteria bacterium]|nr:type I pullulanase [Gammaproteobacteria bacterium]